MEAVHALHLECLCGYELKAQIEKAPSEWKEPLGVGIDLVDEWITDLIVLYTLDGPLEGDFRLVGEVRE